MKSGIVEACTGVIPKKPILVTASRIHSASGGVNASHARDDEHDLAALDVALAMSGAIWSGIVFIGIVFVLKRVRNLGRPRPD